MPSSQFLSREALAGYDRARLERAVFALVGAGALANNIAQTLGLLGIGEVRIIDPDIVDISNVTRSPFFRIRGDDRKPRWKAREVARRLAMLSYATSPVIRYAIARIETLGLGALAGADVIVCAVDSHRARGWLADASRLLGIPLVEGGFSGFSGSVSVWPNRDPAEPCWRCLVPHADSGGVSCSLYARDVSASGGTPATQTVAATVAGFVTEAAIAALHGEFPLENRLLTFDVRRGESRMVTVTVSSSCPGVHRRLGQVHQLSSRAGSTLKAVLEEVSNLAREPHVILPVPFVVRLPCARCGVGLTVHRPAWTVDSAPTCPSDCAPIEGRAPAAIDVVHDVGPESMVARMKGRRVGYAPGAIVEVEDRATGELHAVRLAGAPDDLFVTMRGPGCHVPASAPTVTCEGDERPSKEP